MIAHDICKLSNGLFSITIIERTKTTIHTRKNLYEVFKVLRDARRRQPTIQRWR